MMKSNWRVAVSLGAALVSFMLSLTQGRAQTVACVEGVSLHLSYDATAPCSFGVITDTDPFTVYGVAGSEIRITAVGLSGSVTPNLEIRDPMGVVLHNGLCNGGGLCESSNFNVVPSATLTKTGTYFITVSEDGTNNTGSYESHLTCLFGPCDSDGDGNPNPSPSQIDYDTTIPDSFDRITDHDRLTFEGTLETEIRLTTVGLSGSVAPHLEIRDPDGFLLHDGPCNGGGLCESSDFNVVPSATLTKTGTYFVTLSEAGTNNTGSYETHLTCLSGPCDRDGDLIVDLDDNCLDVANPTQNDVDTDGVGTSCDPDYDNTGIVTIIDFGLFKGAFGCSTGNACYLAAADHDGSGVITILDFGIFKTYFDLPPGPAGLPALHHDETISDSFDRITDHDPLTFEGTAGTEVRITSAGLSGSVSPHLEIRDPFGDLVHDGSCGSGCEAANFNLVPSSALTETGTYFITISEEGTNNTGSYELHLTCLFGPCDSDGDGNPDPSPSQIDYDATIPDSFDHITDHDRLTFEGTLGTEVRLTTVGLSGSVAPNLEIRDPDGFLLHDGPCNGGGLCESSDFNVVPSATLTKTGTYFVTLSESDTDNTGSYETSLACLFPPGVCGGP